MTELTESEIKFMDKAFEYAEQALKAQEVPVGCIFVYNGDIIALGRNEVNETRNATRHAEMICIDQVVKFAKEHELDHTDVFKDIEVFVTVEPCIMCAAALYNLKVKCVLFGCQNDRFGGKTVFDVAEVMKPETVVRGGYRAEEAMNLLKEFYKGSNPRTQVPKVEESKGS